MGCKRGRFLIRQPRIKKELDTEHISPDVEIDHPPHYPTGLLTIPTKIERHSSEPSTSSLMTMGSSPHLLAVPQPSFLVKQHSHPLLPSQSQSPPTTTLTLQRQLSHPITHSSSICTTPTSSFTTQLSTESNISQIAHLVGTTIKTEDVLISSKTNSPTVVIVSDPSSTSIDIPTIRIKAEELQRSVSTPQVTTREISIENARSSHCPVVRPGPALGCNFCWNTIDAHGRILRRKTKYHCPECQTNLCIVPCFQEFHERQANEGSTSNSSSTGASGGGNSTNENNKHIVTGTLRHFPKTGSL